ncbi:UNVERIFIED_CONTAM: hypothetical protein K2H54_070925 [Gekko kuhli]
MEFLRPSAIPLADYEKGQQESKQGRLMSIQNAARASKLWAGRQAAFGIQTESEFRLSTEPLYFGLPGENDWEILKVAVTFSDFFVTSLVQSEAAPFVEIEFGSLPRTAVWEAEEINLWTFLLETVIKDSRTHALPC